MRHTTIRNAFFATFVLALLAACGGGGSPSGSGGGTPPPPPTPPPVALEAGTFGDGRMMVLVEAVRDRHNLPAFAAVVVSGGQIVDIGASGLRAVTDSAAVTTSDQWHIGSLTKAMTATLTAIMVEQSLISWDTTPLDIWPENAATMQAQFQSVTVVDLLSHQSGMSVTVDTIPSFDQVRDSAIGTTLDKRRLWAKELLEFAPANATGEYMYSNAGYIVVGAMLEAVTGTSWETMITDQVFGPLGMTETGFGAPGTFSQFDQPLGHVEDNGSLVPVHPGQNADNPRSIGPAGTVHTTLNDYAKYMFAHLEGERGIPGIMTVASFQFLHTPVGNSSYALGWGTDFTQADAQGPVYDHTGSNGRWWANVALVPGLNVGALMVINAATTAAQDATDELGQLLVQRLENSQ